MEAARSARERQGEAQAAAEAFVSRLADSDEFAAQFDEAVMREDRERVLALVAEAGVSGDVEVTIVDLDPDRSIEIKFCIWRFCVSIKFTW
jgi:hypothetical protein